MKWRQLIPVHDPKSDASNKSRKQKPGARPLSHPSGPLLNCQLQR